MEPVRIILTGGGTGGHIFPLIAVARELKALSPTVKLHFVGPTAFGKEEMQQENIHVHGIIAGKIPRYATPKLFLELLKIPVGFVMALWRLYWLMPDVVFGKGGFGMLPVALAAWFYRIPVIIHESDAVAGLATRIAANISKTVFTSFPITHGLEKHTVTSVGNPVRNTLAHGDAARGQQRFGIAMQQVVLVLGGSQGAEEINALMLRVAPELAGEAEVIHQVGEANIDTFNKELEQVLRPHANTASFYRAYGFLDEEAMADAYAVATVVIARAGASLIGELAQAGLPTVFIPLAGAQNHQYANAEVLSNAGAGLLLGGEELTPHLLLDQVKWLLADEKKRQEFSQHIGALAKPQAAADIAGAILQRATSAAPIT